MPTRPQTFGAFVLGDTLGKTSLGDIVKALPLEGPPEMRLLHRVSDELGKTPESKVLILKQAKQWAAVKDLHVLNLLEAGESEGALFYTFEYSQGRLLSDILERSHHEGLPVSADQAVYLAQRVAQTLASISGQSLICGCLSPERVLITFEGEVKLLPSPLKDLQTTPILASPALELYRRYLPPAQASGKVAKSASDRYSVGAMLFEFLRQEPFCPASGPFDPAARLEEGRRAAAGGEPIPESLYAILRKCLVQDAPDAYPDLAALKADLDQLITSGEYSPTTFNIAFLMHTLFRGEDELQAASDKAFAALDRSALRPAKPEPPPPPPKAPPPPAPPKVAPPAEEPTSFGLEPEPNRKGLYIGVGAAVAVVAFAILIWLAFFRSRGPAQPDAQTQQQLAELNRLKAAQEDLARKLQSSEEEKKRLQDQMATAKTADEKAKAQKALEETQNRLLAQQEEQKKLAATAAKAPAPAPVEPPASRPATTQAPAPQAAATPPPAAAPPPTAPPAPQPAPEPVSEPVKRVNAGDLVELWNVDVKPKQLNEFHVEPTPGVRLNHPTGSIVVEVLIDETGKVASATVVKGLKPDYGMNAACQEAALRLKYSPALKDGVPVKTKMTIPPVLLK